MFVYIRVPPNNPINARAPSFGPRLSLFSEVNYGKVMEKNLDITKPRYSEQILPVPLGSEINFLIRAPAGDQV